MAVPPYQALMLPLLQCVSDGAEWNRSACAEKVSAVLGLSAEDMAALVPSGTETLIYNRIGWARSYMQKAGLVRGTRWGHFQITDSGLALLAEKPKSIDNKFLLRYPSFAEWFNTRFASNNGTEKTIALAPQTQENPEEMIGEGIASLTEQLKSDLLDYLRSDRVSPTLFEQIIIDLLIATGYGGGRAEMGKALGRTGDGGVDGVIHEDELGLDVVYIQAKKYKDTCVGRPHIQAFVGSLEGVNATKGVFVTTSYFSSEAKDYISRVHKRVVLIDGERLAHMMIKNNVGVRVKETFYIKKLDEEYFS